MNAFQSLIWNKMVSKRLKLFGMKPVVGDFVSIEACEKPEEVLSKTVDEEDENNEDGDKDKEAVEKGTMFC